MSRAKKCCKLCLLDWHYSALFFYHHDWKQFAYTPWLPYKWPFQLIYVVYRWCLMIYFMSWQVYSIHTYPDPLYLVFLTHWAFIWFNLSLIISALSVTAKLISVHCICKRPEEEFTRRYELKWSAPLGCCGITSNNLSWYQMVHWLFTAVAFGTTVSVFVLYWSTIYSGGSVDGINANTHLVNAIVAIIDFGISGIPVNTLHVIYPMIFGVAYTLCNGLFYAATQTPVYPVTDFGERLGVALIACLATIFLLLPFLHLAVYYGLYKLKVLILYFLFRSTTNEETQEEEMEKDPHVENPYT